MIIVNSEFPHKQHDYVHTGNMCWIDIVPRHDIMEIRINFREMPQRSKYKLTHSYQDAIDKLPLKLSRHPKNKIANVIIGKTL